jgi:hypothetical protein
VARSIRTKEAVAGEPPVRVVNKTYSAADEHRQVVVIDEGGGEGTSEVIATGLAKNAPLLTIADALAGIASALAALATAAKQDTGNSSLSAIAGKDFATQTTLALIKAKTDYLQAPGQATMAASTPVVLASDQADISVSPGAGWMGGVTVGTDLSDGDVPGVVCQVNEDGASIEMRQPVTDTQLRASPLSTVQASATYYHSRPTITTNGATSLVLGAAARKWVELCNNNSVTVFINMSGAATVNQGIPLSPGSRNIFYCIGAIYGVVAAGSVVLDVYEVR